jgi:hypothetical protein
MSKGLFLAWTSPVSDERDAEFNSWYETTHIPQVRAIVPAITAVHRYSTADLPGGQQPAHRYLAVYELDCDDVPAVAAALGEAISAGKLDMSTAVDLSTNPPVSHWYQTAG